VEDMHGSHPRRRQRKHCTRRSSCAWSPATTVLQMIGTMPHPRGLGCCDARMRQVCRASRPAYIPRHRCLAVNSQAVGQLIHDTGRCTRQRFP
jgi:hypothetical protein